MNLALAATSARLVSRADHSLVLPRLLCLDAAAADRLDAAAVDRLDAAAVDRLDAAAVDLLDAAAVDLLDAAPTLCCAAAVAVFSFSFGCLSFRCLERSVPLPASAIAG